MIRVSVSQTLQKIHSLSISGHAAFAKHGEDLVCAGVSSVATGALNALDQIASQSCELRLSNEDDASIEINVLDLENRDVQIILHTVLIQLETIENQYSQYIHISKEEV